MAIRRKAAGAKATKAPNTGGVGITGNLGSGIEQQIQQALQAIQNNPTGGYTGGTTPPYQQSQPRPPIDYPVWGPNGPPRPPMFPITGPGMRGIPPGGGWGISGGPIVRQPQPIQQQPQGPQMDWSGLMGKLQGILNPYLSGGTGTAAGGAGGGQNPMQSVMGALMGSLGGFMNQMPSGAQSGGMDWQNLAKQIQNPTAGTGGDIMKDIMGLMGQFSSSGQQQQQPPPTGGQVGNIPQPGQPGFTADDWKYYMMPLAQGGGGSRPYSLAGGTPAYSQGLGYSPPGSNMMAY